METKSLYRALSLRGKGLLLSQIADTYQQRVAIFCGAEVKRSGGDDLESLAQLAIWLTAGLRRGTTLQVVGNREVDQFTPANPIQFKNKPLLNPGLGEGPKDHKTMPLLGWTIHGHDWCLYLAWNMYNECNNTVRRWLLNSSIIVSLHVLTFTANRRSSLYAGCQY